MKKIGNFSPENFCLCSAFAFSNMLIVHVCLPTSLRSLATSSFTWAPSRYGELQGLNKQETTDKFGKEKVHQWRRSYDIPPPNGESLEMCAERDVAYFREQIVPQLHCGKNVLIAAHGNSLWSIVMYLDKLSSQEVIILELSTGIPMLYIFKECIVIRRGSPIGPSEAGVYAVTKNLALCREKLDDMIH